MSALRGIARLARFRVDGFAEFVGTSQAVLNSLAPLVAFPLAGGLLQAGQGEWQSALSDLLATIVALLTPLVVTEFLARRWGREALWLRFAVASNWCQWAIPMALMAIVLVLWMGAQLGMHPSKAVVGGCLIGLICYGIALHYFLARVGLQLPRGRAVVMVLAADLLTGLLVVGPRLFMEG